MTIAELIAQARASISEKLKERAEQRAVISKVRSDCAQAENRAPSEAEEAAVRAANTRTEQIDAEVLQLQARITELEDEERADEAANRLQREISPGAPGPGNVRTQRTEVREKRTYSEDSDPKGLTFLMDVARQHLNLGGEAASRLAQHMQEERTERGEQIDRFAGSANFSGLVVPQYLVDLYAPLARAGRPFADACRHHDLPETGLTAYIGKVTTGTNVDEQAAEGDTVAEQDMDDTLISVPIRTNAGSQSVPRQALERGIGVEDTTVQDLFASYDVALDKKLLNRATTGLTNVATSITYTDASPTAQELYPKLVQGPAEVEAALLDQMIGDTIAVMHSRRWYWLQSQLSATWPLFGSSGIPSANAGLDYGKVYGSGFRGVLPTGVPVIVDNNIVTGNGAGTNEDEVYFGAQSEFHLWEDPSAPMLIRAEQNQAKKLLVDFVVYGYYAFLANRRDHARKLQGTGLSAPTWA